MVTSTESLLRIVTSSVVVALAGTPCLAQGTDQARKQQTDFSVTILSNTMQAPSTITAIAATSNDLRVAQSTGSSSQKLYTSMSGDEIESLLKSMNFIYNRTTDRSGDPIFRIAIDRYRVALITDDCSNSRCSIIQLYAGFDLPGTFDMDKINEWNRTKRFARAYVDEEGDPILETELSLEGGVSSKAIEKFIRIYSGALPRFAEFIGL